MRRLLIPLAPFALLACDLGSGDGEQPDPVEPAEALEQHAEYEEDRVVGVSYTEGGDPSMVGNPDDGTGDGQPGTGGQPGADGTGGTPVCAGDLASDSFAMGLCVCGDMDQIGALETVAIDGSANAAIGTNGDFLATGDSHVRGDLVVAGRMSPIGNHDVEGELRVGGEMLIAGDVHVFSDAHVGGDLGGYWYRIDGSLHVPADASLPLALDVEEDIVLEAVDVPNPCDCDGAQLDVDLFVQQASNTNDNEAIGLATDSLVRPSGAKELPLPPGRYYLDEVDTLWPVHITITGPTAIYVAGDLASTSIFELELEGPDAEVDLFVAGSVVATGVFELGSRERFNDVRVYIDGSEDLVLLGDLELGGNVWAPNANLVSAGPLDIYGSLLVGGLLNDGLVRVHYDPAVQAEDETCQP
jgi:hypothetical protein